MNWLKKSVTWYWLLAVGCFLFQALYLYRNFFYYHADTGWELYSIWAASQGAGHSDFLMSWRAGYLFNVPFMQFFQFNLYDLRLLFLCSWLLSLSLLVIGLDKKFIKNEVLPAALIIACLFPCYYTDFIVDYYTAPALFLSLSLGLLLIGLRQTSQGLVGLMLVLSAIAMACASLSNIGVLPAGILSSLIILGLYRNKKAAVFCLSYFIVLGILAFCYFDLFKVAHILLSPMAAGGDVKAHFAKPHILLQQFGMGSFALTLMCIGLACAAFIYYLGWSDKKILGASPYMFYIITALLSCFMVSPNLSGDFVVIYMFYIIHCLFIVGLTYLAFQNNAIEYRKSSLLILSLTVIYYLAHRATSNNLMGVVLLNYNSLLFIALLPLIFSSKEAVYKHFSFFACITGTTVFIIASNLHPSAGNVFTTLKRNTYLVPELGIKSNFETYHVMQNMQTAYYAQNCQDKLFLSFYDNPISYYLFKRLAPYNQSWVSQNTFYPENLSFNSDSVIQLLSQSSHWCVIYSANGDGDGMPDNKQFLQKAHQYIVSHASKAVPLGYQPYWNKSYTLYAK
ncbi:MAG: hypothetical protein K0S29_472 [Gammaproteobacteria bacterium]|nr:hypothetical protein [Gammaproteobacteria bacterium]